MRRHLTKLRWYDDRLCSLSAGFLISLTLGCLVGLGLLAVEMAHFLDDVPILLAEGDPKMVLTFFDLLLLTSIALWLLSYAAGALIHRIRLYIKGL